MTGWTWVEPFAGAAACALRLVGGKDLAPPVAWMGGKRRLARAILDAMGVPDSPPSRVLLADAGPWGWVWPLLLRPTDAAAVAGVLRSWAGEHPRDLWQRLAAQPPAEDLHERAAQWLWLQARSASGVPIWWDGWRLEAGNGKVPTDRGEDLRWPAHRAERAAWKASDGRGDPRPAGQRADADRWSQADHATGRTMAAGQTHPGWAMGEEVKKSRRGTRTMSQGHPGARWEKGTPDGRAPQDATNGQRGWARSTSDGAGETDPVQRSPRWRASNGAGDEVTAGQKSIGSWRFDARPCDVAPDRLAGPAGTTNGRTGGMVDPCTIASRIEAIAQAFRDVDVTVHHGDVRELVIPRGAFVYDDPPYENATGYGWHLARAEVLALARAHRKRAAVVAVSEAVRLPLRGWHAFELTREGGKPEWLTMSRAPARFPERQADLFTTHAPASAPAPAGSGGG